PFPGFIDNRDDQDYQLRVSLSLRAERKSDRVAIIRKDYGEIELSADFIDIPATSIQSFVIYRKEAGTPASAYQSAAVFTVQEPYSFTFIDKYLDKEKNYTYIAVALDAPGNVIGESKEKTI
ncbi:MAG: hypothetical protein GY757_54040, partial [bacterium]|nr:hypothetical protein [bacterium]